MATRPKSPTKDRKMRPGHKGNGLLKTGGDHIRTGRPPTKHIRERILELIAEGKIDQDTLIHEMRDQDRALFLAYAYGRPQADVTSGGKPINGVVVIGPDELKDI